MTCKINKDGYFANDKRQLEHRVVYQKHHGIIPALWVVHHLDTDKINNDIENLIALPARIHNLLHKYQKQIRRRLSRIEVEKFLKENTKYKPRIKPKAPKFKKLRPYERKLAREAFREGALKSQDLGEAKEWLKNKGIIRTL